MKNDRKRYKDGKAVDKKDKGKKSPEKKDDKKKGKDADKKKDVIMDVQETKPKIEEFMLRHNRPFSTQDILNCFQSSMRKRQADEALEELVKEKSITLKEYGKAKVFLINQSRFPEVDTSLLEAMDD